MSAAALAPAGAMAQGMSAADAAQMRAQIDALRAQVQALETRLNSAAPAPATPVAPTAPAPAPAAPPAVIAAAPAPAPAPATTEWKGAPEMRTASGWSFKPRGRMQLDVAGVDGPAAINDTGLGFGSEFRRVYLGFDGTMPGGFGYRIEADLADNAVALTDVYMTWTRGHTQIMLGQHKPFSSMEDMTSDLFTSFQERAAFNSAFGFERRVGLSATYSNGALVAQGGVFTDDVSALNAAQNNSWSVDGRLSFDPRVGDAQLHVGISAHSRDFNDAATTTRYRARPFVHTTDTRLVDTGAFTATGEYNVGAEFAAISGRFHVAAESQWMTARRAGLIDPTFHGGYAEAGLFLTNDRRRWRGGTFDRTQPAHAVGANGMGAVELNLRYDWLDLNDAAAGLTGGHQSTYGVAMTWNPTNWARLTANYGHVVVNDARIAAGTDRDYNAEALGLRAQIDF